MPICTSCAAPTPYLFTVYDSAYNFRLEQCTSCHAFADPYVEHDALTLLLDLILLKRDVYRHLLYNRGLGARKVGRMSTVDDTGKPRSDPASIHHDQSARWWLIAKLGFALICVDAFIRWTHISSNHPGDRSQIATWNQAALEGFVHILVGCLFETAAFHAGVVLACYLVLKLLPSPAPSSSPVSGIREQFRYVRRGYPAHLPFFFRLLPCPAMPSTVHVLPRRIESSSNRSWNIKPHWPLYVFEPPRHIRPWRLAGPVVKLKLPSALLSEVIRPRIPNLASPSYAVRALAIPLLTLSSPYPRPSLPAWPPGRPVVWRDGVPVRMPVAGGTRFSHIPLTLFYSSLTKLFLLFCLSIWHPGAAASSTRRDADPLAPLHPRVAAFPHVLVARALGLLDEDTLDREWVVRNVLGGMSAGFGLRVVLDCHPVFTTMIILAGWLVKTAVANLVSGWVGMGLGLGGDDNAAAGEMWLAYSIP